MKIVHIDACFSGLFNDMASQWMSNEMPILNELFIGWQKDTYMEDDWDMFSRNIWYSLGERQSNFFAALNYALDYNNNPSIRSAIMYVGDDQVCFP